MLKQLNITKQVSLIRDGVKHPAAGAALSSVIGDIQGVTNAAVVRLSELDSISQTDNGDISIVSGAIRKFVFRRLLSDPPDIQYISSASYRIPLVGEFMRLSNTSGGALTLTSVPTVAAGANGEIIELLNLSVPSIILQDNGTLAGSKLHLHAATVEITQGNSVRLRYSTDLGQWDEECCNSTLNANSLTLVSNYTLPAGYSLVVPRIYTINSGKKFTIGLGGIFRIL